MKTRLLLAFAAVFLIFASTSEAGWRGGGYCGPRGGWGWGGGGYCGPRIGWGGGWGGGWYGPSIGVSIAAPLPVYRRVYYTQPAPSYVVYRTVQTSSTLAKAQAKLTNFGYYRGGVDGAFGPQTSRALSLYQSDNRLPITGRLDRATQKSLGI
jgi:hypothetical protein